MAGDGSDGAAGQRRAAAGSAEARAVAAAWAAAARGDGGGGGTGAGRDDGGGLGFGFGARGGWAVERRGRGLKRPARGVLAGYGPESVTLFFKTIRRAEKKEKKY